MIHKHVEKLYKDELGW